MTDTPVDWGKYASSMGFNALFTCNEEQFKPIKKQKQKNPVIEDKN